MVRFITRLNETCRDVKNVAESSATEHLKMEDAMALIRRDLVFSRVPLVLDHCATVVKSVALSVFIVIVVVLVVVVVVMVVVVIVY